LPRKNFTEFQKREIDLNRKTRKRGGSREKGERGTKENPVSITEEKI